MGTNIVRFQQRNGAKTLLNLPGPRIWTVKDLADFLRVSVSWVHKRTKKDAADPPPRCPGVSELRFDTQNPQFQMWVARQIGVEIDREGDANV